MIAWQGLSATDKQAVLSPLTERLEVLRRLIAALKRIEARHYHQSRSWARPDEHTCEWHAEQAAIARSRILAYGREARGIESLLSHAGSKP